MSGHVMSCDVYVCIERCTVYIVPGMPHCVRSSAITSSKWLVAGHDQERIVHASPTFILGVAAKSRWEGPASYCSFQGNEINIFHQLRRELDNYNGRSEVNYSGQQHSFAPIKDCHMSPYHIIRIIAHHIISYLPVT